MVSNTSPLGTNINYTGTQQQKFINFTQGQEDNENRIGLVWGKYASVVVSGACHLIYKAKVYRKHTMV